MFQVHTFWEWLRLSLCHISWASTCRWHKERKFVNTTKPVLMEPFGKQSGSTRSTVLLLCSRSCSPCSLKSIKWYLQQLQYQFGNWRVWAMFCSWIKTTAPGEHVCLVLGHLMFHTGKRSILLESHPSPPAKAKQPAASITWLPLSPLHVFSLPSKPPGRTLLSWLPPPLAFSLLPLLVVKWQSGYLSSPLLVAPSDWSKQEKG